MADINQVITWGIGDPSGIEFYILNGLGVGGAPPTTANGGAVVPVRGWNGREYWDGNSKGNVETVYRERTTGLVPQAVTLRVRVSGKLQHYLPTIRPAPVLPREPEVVEPAPTPVPVVSRLNPAPVVLKLSLTGNLEFIPAEVVWSARLREKAEAVNVREQELAEARKLISRLKEEIISLEDELLLGVS